MKKSPSKFTTISIVTAALTITSPTTAIDRFDVDIAKPYLVGGAIVATVGLAGWYLFGGKEKSDTLTKAKLDEAITPLRAEIEALKRQLSEAQRSETLSLINTNMQKEEYLEFLRNRLLPNNLQPNEALQTQTLSELPSTPPRKLSAEEQAYQPSPAKKLDDREKKSPLSRYQESVKWALDKGVLSERIWKLLEEGNSAAEPVSSEINKTEYAEAIFFDYTFKSQSSCKMVITINNEKIEKRITLK